MKRVINKNTLSFSTSKIMKYLRTPPNIWDDLKNEFNFTIDACSSELNHLCDIYYTIDNSCLDKDWTNNVVYCHPMFDMHIGNFVKKAYESKCITVMLLPASTHTRYFHRYCYKNPNCEIRFLEKPNKGFHFGHDDGSIDEPNKIGYIKPLMILIFRNV